MVASTHWIASAVGFGVLERGGNAFDAAVATGFALQVVEPHLNGPGGEVVALIATAEDPAPRVLCGQGPAPAAATIERYRDLGLDLVPGTGLLAACVPGAFDAWMKLLLERGTMKPRDVLAPAVELARDGFPLVPRIPDAIARVRNLFETAWPTSAAVYLPGGRLPAPGERFRNPALAATYQRIVDEAEARTSDRDGQIGAARDAFYRGFVAEAFAEFASTQDILDTSGRKHRGLIEAADLARFEAAFEPPVSLDYHGLTVCKAGPWTQGPAFLQQLALLAGFDLAAMPADGPDYVHTVIECAKLAFADRDAHYGDPDLADVPVDALLDPAYAARRRALIDDTASTEHRPGSPAGSTPRLPRHVTENWHAASTGSSPTAGAGEPTIDRTGNTRGDTCQLEVLDRHGNLVAATPSGGWLQSSPVIPELGFCLGTRAQMFWLEPGLPGSLAPGKRPRTTLTPTIVCRDGAPVLAFGTPGGDQQDQWTLGFFLAHVHRDLDLAGAMDAPMFHTEHLSGSFYPRESHPARLVIESRFPDATIAELRRRGHDVVVADPWSLGRTCAVAHDREARILKAAANPRGMQAYALGR